MQQLDLFGNIEPPVQKASVKKSAVEETLTPKESTIASDNASTENTIQIPDIPNLKIRKYTLKKPAVIEQVQEPIAEAPIHQTVVTIAEQVAASEEAVGKRGRKSFKEIDAEIDTVELPDDEILFQKQYYAISEVAKWFNVNNSLLRYWENEFDILKPRKTRKGDRLFRPEDVKNLQVIYYLLRQRKFTIEGAKEYLKNNKTKADTNVQLINALTKFRGFLLELRANLGE
jgi:DNA-binding transcriptional MerR regulator